MRSSGFDYTLKADHLDNGYDGAYEQNYAPDDSYDTNDNSGNGIGDTDKEPRDDTQEEGDNNVSE